MITIDRDYLLAALADLVRINSINPDLVPGAPGETAAAAYMAGNLKRLGLRVETVEAAPGRPSVIATLKGRGGGKSLMFNGHIDVVGVDGMSEPFSPSIRNGRLYGRGAYDMKGSVAACMAALKALVDANAALRGDVVLAAVADEEYASIGTAEVIKHVRVDAAVVAEPTEMEICLAHKGFVWIEVETTGRAAHGSRFDEGIDANMMMGRFLAELDRLERELRARPPHPLVGPPSLHAATLRGGTELSMYAAACKLQIERRTVPGETEASVIAELQAIVDQLSHSDPSFKATLKTLLVRDSMEVSTDAPIVKAVTHAATDLLVKPPPYVGRPFWMDAARTRRRNGWIWGRWKRWRTSSQTRRSLSANEPLVVINGLLPRRQGSGSSDRQIIIVPCLPSSPTTSSASSKPRPALCGARRRKSSPSTV